MVTNQVSVKQKQHLHLSLLFFWDQVVFDVGQSLMSSPNIFCNSCKNANGLCNKIKRPQVAALAFVNPQMNCKSDTTINTYCREDCTVKCGVYRGMATTSACLVLRWPLNDVSHLKVTLLKPDATAPGEQMVKWR